ncbi:Aspartic proteinase yapsin-3 [Colletotrichum chlorophyti]|uniref:Aspartic proteinase yapsin-3 n=1 Tax=Colletotrichum chlorophyti TaxID=708187 RepID=A0A1Q8RUQ4_9PEZI|nr:Aspartic proteinase yapsin-3 [Colletotrichum chlorophyti]
MLKRLLVATVLAGIVRAQSQSAVALTPSSDWYGIDGNWSAVKIQVGTPEQSANVLVSTSLSEFWVVGTGGCLAKEPLCNSARGNVFTISNSKTWNPLGAWQLGLNYLGYGGNGDYGLDTLSATLLTGGEISMNNIITASINSTDYYLGYLGLGLTKGSFGDQIAESPLTQAVKNYGLIPSYSYGYTAGAYYKGTSGTPCSVTLGGYDASRFIPHSNEFSLDPSDGLPHALVRGIEVTVGDGKEIPNGWDAATRVLSNMSTSFSAIIDSSTPYFWLPEAVCDEFAKALNLTYNSTFDLYTVTNEHYAALRAGSSSYSFTFSFTSHDNNDDFGRPLQVPGVVNITITAAAFAQVLRYPFLDESIKYGEPAVPYFPLRRTSNLTSTFVIGRTFLQEAYLITKYDTGVFSLHQALFPNEPLQQLQLQSITQPDNSPFPPPKAQESSTHNGLTTVQMAGIAGGVAAACLTLLIYWYCCRRRGKARATSTRSLEDGKDAASSIIPEPPASPIVKIFTRILGKKRPKRCSAHEVMGSTSQPVEVGADANHAVYELPAPVGPIELDGDDSKSVNEHTEFGTDETHNLGAYELARRKVDMQLRGPVPAYTPPENPANLPPPEKTLQDLSPTATITGTDLMSMDFGLPASVRDSSSSNHSSLPSPMSPRVEWTNRMSSLPSPLTEGLSYSSPTFSVSNSGTTMPQPVSPESEAFTTNLSDFTSSPPSIPLPAIPVSPPSTYQRTPIDSSNVICLGPLPNNVCLSGPGETSPPFACSQGHDIVVPEILSANRLSTDTLGSNWTEFEQELIAQELTRQGSLPGNNGRSRSAEGDFSRSQQCIDGSELIHVPQMAERRYSWEE